MLNRNYEQDWKGEKYCDVKYNVENTTEVLSI